MKYFRYFVYAQGSCPIILPVNMTNSKLFKNRWICSRHRPKFQSQLRLKMETKKERKIVESQSSTIKIISCLSQKARIFYLYHTSETPLCEKDNPLLVRRRIGEGKNNNLLDILRATSTSHQSQFHIRKKPMVWITQFIKSDCIIKYIDT